MSMLLKTEIRKESSSDLHSPLSLPLSTPSLLLQQYADTIPFPKYFKSLYQFLSELHLVNSEVDNVYTAGLGQRRQAIEKVQNSTRWVPEILRSVTPEGKDVLLPYLTELFSESDTGLHASLLILHTVMQHYGPGASVKSLLQPMLKTYDSDFTSPNAVLLFHRSFVSQLMMRFGQKIFLTYLLEFIVNATTGIKYCPRYDEAVDEPIGVMPETGRSRFLSEATEALDFLKTGNFPTRTFIHNSVSDQPGDIDRGQSDSAPIEEEVQDSLSSSDEDAVTEDTDSSKKCHSTSGDSSSLDQLSTNEDSYGSSMLPKDLPSDSSPPDTDINPPSQSPRDAPGTSVDSQGYPDSTQDASGQDTQDSSPVPRSIPFPYGTPEPDDIHLAPSIDLASSSYFPDVSAGSSMVSVAVESVMWLAHRLGPALTATFLSGKLLRALAQCYLGRHQLANWDEDSDSEESSDGEYSLVGTMDVVPNLEQDLGG